MSLRKINLCEHGEEHGENRGQDERLDTAISLYKSSPISLGVKTQEEV